MSFDMGERVDCRTSTLKSVSRMAQTARTTRTSQWGVGRTEDDDVQDKDDEPDNSPAGAILPGVVAAGDDLPCDGRSGDEGGHPELEESRKHEKLHHVDCTVLIVLVVDGTMIDSEEIDDLR